MSDNKPQGNKPFLRALKLAYKLHKEGVSVANVQTFVLIAADVAADKLPSAAAPSEVIFAEVVNNAPNTAISSDYIASVAAQLGAEVR